MKNCNFKVEGKSLTPQELEDKIRSQGAPHYTLEHRPQDIITTEEAKAITKAWLPNSVIEGNGSWLRFIPKLILSSVESSMNGLLTKISNKAIELETLNSKVYKNQLVHELMHLIYHYGMSPKWKERFNSALKKEYSESFQNLSKSDVEHLISTYYENTKLIESSLSKWVSNMKSLFKFFVLNKKDLKTLEGLIKGGYFSKSVTQIEMDYTASYSFIKKYFGNVNSYESAKA